METVVQVVNGVKKATYDEYMVDAENGYREFFEWHMFGFGEGSRYTKEDDNLVLEDTITYFIMYKQEDEETVFYKINESTMMEFMKINFCTSADYKEECMIDQLIKIGVISLK